MVLNSTKESTKHTLSVSNTHTYTLSLSFSSNARHTHLSTHQFTWKIKVKKYFKLFMDYPRSQTVQYFLRFKMETDKSCQFLYFHQ